MKVALWPKFNLSVDKGEGGIKRVVEAQHRYLPDSGIEIVDVKHADLIAVHADEYISDTPQVFHNHGMYWQGYDWQNWSYSSNAKAKRMARKAVGITVPSNFVHNVFARGMLLDPTIIHHGIYLEDWEPAENYGYIGWYKNRVDPICTPEPLNIIAKQCPDLSFLSTYGDPDLTNITTVGRVPFQTSKEFIRHASLYLATVKETGGVTVLENMACGVVPVGWNWGVNPELITHLENGYLAEPGNYDDLIYGLYYCMRNRDRMGLAAREYVIQNHQWKDVVPKYATFYKEALEGTRRAVGLKVSVIVTAYKLEQYLPACLDSIMSQDFESWECIIVDDNSPDQCGMIADDYARKDKRFRVIHNPTNLYLAEARNTGIRCSYGQYILPLDADDELGPHTLRILSEALDHNHNQDIVTGAFQLIEPNKERWVSTWPPENPTYNEQIQMHNQMPYSSMYRKWVWERTGGYRRRWKSAEDADFWTRAMSYGAIPAKVTDAPTLVYNNRPNSMSHTTNTPNWTAWYPWSYLPTVTPFGASDLPSKNVEARDVLDYDPIDVSVIIPCGPGHVEFLQDAIDSVVAQTFQRWNIIVINDTGSKWFDEEGKCINPYIGGYPFVTFLDCEIEGKSSGPARARNRGISESHSSYFVLLDADDYLQPLALRYLYDAIRASGESWVYTDFLDELGNAKESENFAWDRALIKMPGPITGIYKKEHWLKVGGFDEKIVLWEDYSYLLSLMEYGICGVRLKYPAFTYRYDRGNRREWAHEHAKEALKEIQTKHRDLIQFNKCKE